jgi:hypothetical protein
MHQYFAKLDCEAAFKTIAGDKQEYEQLEVLLILLLTRPKTLSQDS